MVNDIGGLEFNSSTAASQRDLYIISNDINISNYQYTIQPNLIFNVYRDGAFNLVSGMRLCKIEFSITYKYLNSIGVLPFEISVFNNDAEIYKKQYGMLDQFNQINKIDDNFIILLSNGYDLKFYIKKLYTDQGTILIKSDVSYMGIEIL